MNLNSSLIPQRKLSPNGWISKCKWYYNKTPIRERKKKKESRIFDQGYSEKWQVKNINNNSNKVTAHINRLCDSFFNSCYITSFSKVTIFSPPSAVLLAFELSQISPILNKLSLGDHCTFQFPFNKFWKNSGFPWWSSG